jgi:hypothetical protein
MRPVKSRGRPPNGEEGIRCDIRPSADQASYLDDLVKLGLYGKTRTEVARYLVVQGLERLVQAGLLKIRQAAAETER